jgi:hypothetical protein
VPIRRAFAALSFSVVLAAGLAGLPGLPVAPVAAAPANFPAAVWSASIGRVHLSAPAIADVNRDGVNDIVVGDLDGWVRVLDGRTGGNVPGWPQQVHIRDNVATAIETSPTVADLDKDGSPEIVVGAGSLDVANQPGGVEAFNANGSMRWRRESRDVYNMWTGGGPDGLGDGVESTPAVGDIDGDGFPDVVWGSFDHQIYGVNRNGSEIFPSSRCDSSWCGNGDTVWSSPALYDIDGDGKKEIFIGGDASGYQGCSGGWLRALKVFAGQVSEMWRICRNEIFQSSPTIGDIDNDGRADIVIGTGTFYHRSDTTKVFAFHADDGSLLSGWPVDLNNGPIMGSPALGDVTGDGVTDVVIASGACGSSCTGTVWALRGNGSVIWSNQPTANDEIISTPALVDLNADGVNDVVLAKSITIRFYKGQDGSTLFNPINGDMILQNAPAVADLGAGIGWRLIVAGRPGSGPGFVNAYPLPSVPRIASFPMWRRSADHVGAPNGPLVPPTTGYWLTASDGGIFSFGTAPFYGSAGSIHLNKPIVGMAAPPDGRGYWLVASDGGVFTFGNVGFHGSTGNIALNSPIVGIASTPSGNGYWLVARDGGVFAFGDAPFKGSTGNIHLNQPVVGMASSPTGQGYWLVATDGGIFTFGDAQFLGSTGNIHLNQPIVGMARRPGANGYWMVASDGGIFSFGNAPFYGSTGAIHLNQPIVGMTPKKDGNGYWLVARDGGVFAFNAPFNGSTGGFRLNQPILGIATAP